jgi:hypothetical protein
LYSHLRGRFISGLKPAIGCPSLILLVTGGYLAIGLVVLVAWLIVGKDGLIENFFRLPGALLMVSLAAVSALFSARVCRGFLPGEPLRAAWLLIAFAAATELVATILVQVLGAKSPLNVIGYFPVAVNEIAAIRRLGQVLGGPCRFGLLAAGLWLVLGVYRRAGFLGRYTPRDWMLLAVFGAYIVREGADVAAAFHRGRRFEPAELLHLPVDPLLWLLLAEGLLLYRSVHRMGGGWAGRGWIGKCYGAFSVGVFLILLGDVAVWATAWGYLPWPWSALGWYVWIPAAGAFALGPAYQLEAMHHAIFRRAG